MDALDGAARSACAPLGHSAVDLQKLLAGRLAIANGAISLSTHQISASARPGDLETGLQLLHLHFTQPGNDDEAFANIRKQLDALYANREQNPKVKRSGK